MNLTGNSLEKHYSVPTLTLPDTKRDSGTFQPQSPNKFTHAKGDPKYKEEFEKFIREIIKDYEFYPLNETQSGDEKVIETDEIKTPRKPESPQKDSETSKTIEGSGSSHRMAVIEKIETIDLEKVDQILDSVKETNNNGFTKFIRVVQKIAYVLSWVIYALGWVLAVAAFLSLFTDPSPSLMILSILKGLILGWIVGNYGPIIPNALENSFKCAEVRWTNHKFFKPLEEKKDTLNVEGKTVDLFVYKDTLETLCSMYSVKEKIETYTQLVENDLKRLSHFEKKLIEQEKYSKAQNMLRKQLDKLLLFKKVLCLIEERKETGGKQLKDYMENRSYWDFLTQKV